MFTRAAPQIRIGVAVSLGLALLFAILPLAGQAPDSPASLAGQDPVFRADTSLVVLHVTVVDKKGSLVTDVQQQNFQIYEDGQRQSLALFRQEDVPVSVGVVIDNSGSMRDKRLKVNTAAVAFVKASNPEDEMFIVNFNDEVYLDTDFTSDPERLQDGIQRIDSRGGTALYDSIDLALNHLDKKAKHDKRVLLLISDGEDNSSRADLETLVRRLQESDSQTVIYAIGLLSQEERRSAKRAERALEHITQATGGPAYFPETADEVEALTERIALDIRNQYTLAYRPPDGAEPGFRQIKIELQGDARKHEVRHRPGYFAE